MRPLIGFLFLIMNVIIESKEMSGKPQLKKQSSFGKFTENLCDALSSNKSDSDDEDFADQRRKNVADQKIIERLKWNPFFRIKEYTKNKTEFRELFGGSKYSNSEDES